MSESDVCELLVHSPLFAAPGTWGLIQVLEDQLLYRVLDPASERVLNPTGAAPGLIEQGVPHEVAPLRPVRFPVEFHRMISIIKAVPHCETK